MISNFDYNVIKYHPFMINRYVIKCFLMGFNMSFKNYLFLVLHYSRKTMDCFLRLLRCLKSLLEINDFEIEEVRRILVKN